MIDFMSIDLLSPNAVAPERYQEHDDRKRRPNGFPLHQAIESLYSDRLKHRFTDVQGSDVCQSSRVSCNEGLYRQYLELLRTHLASGNESHILEIGCGRGRFCQSLFENGYQAYGLDPSHLLLQQACLTSRECRFERASAYVPFQDLFLRQFDAIVYLDAIEHLDSPRCFIQRACESLVPGGLLIVTARYRGYLINLTNALSGPTLRAEPLFEASTPASRKTPTTLGRLLRDAGLEIVEFQKAGRLPQPWRSQLFVARKPLPRDCRL